MNITDNKTEILEKIENLKQEIAKVTAQIKELEAIEKKKLSPVFMTLIYILAIASVGLFFFKPIFYIVSLSLLVLIVAIAVIIKLTYKSKEKKRDKQLMQLKLGENKLISELNTAKSKLSTINAALDSQNN
jgi:uncharacterized membrane protein